MTVHIMDVYAPIDDLDFNDLPEASATPAYRRPPVDGRYQVRLPSAIKASDESQENTITYSTGGDLRFVIDGATVVAPGKVEDGYVVKRHYAGTKKFKNQNTNATVELLRGAGVDVQKARPHVAQEYISLMRQAAGKTLSVQLQAEGRCSTCDVKSPNNPYGKSSFVGMDTFPKNDQGQPEAVFDCPQCGETIFTRSRIRRIYATTGNTGTKSDSPGF